MKKVVLNIALSFLALSMVVGSSHLSIESMMCHVSGEHHVSVDKFECCTSDEEHESHKVHNDCCDHESIQFTLDMFKREEISKTKVFFANIDWKGKSISQKQYVAPKVLLPQHIPPDREYKSELCVFLI